MAGRGRYPIVWLKLTERLWRWCSISVKLLFPVHFLIKPLQRTVISRPRDRYNLTSYDIAATRRYNGSLRWCNDLLYLNCADNVVYLTRWLIWLGLLVDAGEIDQWTTAELPTAIAIELMAVHVIVLCTSKAIKTWMLHGHGRTEQNIGLLIVSRNKDWRDINYRIANVRLLRNNARWFAPMLNFIYPSLSASTILC